MALTLIQNVPQVAVGLQTYTFTIPATPTPLQYTVHFEATELPPSGLTVVVKQGLATVFTAPVIAQTQSNMKFDFPFLFTGGDVVTVVMTSVEPNDALLNSVKSICSISNGGR